MIGPTKSSLKLPAAIAAFAIAVLLQTGAPRQVLAADSETTADTHPFDAVTTTSLSHAVKALEESSGGRVLEIRHVTKGNSASFDAIIVRHDNSIVGMNIDMSDKAIDIDVKALPEWMLNWKLRADAQSVWKAKVPLADAIEKAQSLTKSRAVHAGLAKPLTADNAVLAWNVEVVKKDKLDRVAIDAESGLKIANPDKLYDPWMPSILLEKLPS